MSSRVISGTGSYPATLLTQQFLKSEEGFIKRTLLRNNCRYVSGMNAIEIGSKVELMK